MRTCGQLWRAAEAIAIPLHTLCIAANSIVEWQRWVNYRNTQSEYKWSAVLADSRNSPRRWIGRLISIVAKKISPAIALLTWFSGYRNLHSGSDHEDPAGTSHRLSKRKWPLRPPEPKWIAGANAYCLSELLNILDQRAVSRSTSACNACGEA